MFTAFDMPYVDVCGGVPEVVWPCRSLQKWRGQWTDCPQEAARALPGSVLMRVLMARKRVLQQLDHIQIAVLCQDQMICLTMHTSTLCIQPNRFIVQEVIIATAATAMPARCMLGDGNVWVHVCLEAVGCCRYRVHACALRYTPYTNNFACRTLHSHITPFDLTCVRHAWLEEYGTL